MSLSDYPRARPVRPKPGQVWSFHGGPRHDIVSRVFRISGGTKGPKKSGMFCEWRSGMRTLPVREVWQDFRYCGFYFEVGK